MANSSHPFSAAPNFAFELAARKTSDADMAGLDLGACQGIISGSERIHPATLNRFFDRFAPYHFRERNDASLIWFGGRNCLCRQPAEERHSPAGGSLRSREAIRRAPRNACDEKSGAPLLSYGTPKSPIVRIVDPDACVECPAGTVGEIWLKGDNVAEGYWQKPDETQRTFGGMLANPTPGTPEGPWLRTGDLGFISEGEMFIVGRMKDLLIVYGRNHYPEDIESTVQEITGGRVAAISVPVDQTEKLVTIIEVKKRGDSDEEARQKLSVVKNDVTAAISKSHGLNVADLVLVPPGSIPTTTSGKIKRAACVEQYRQQQFTRLDA